MVDAQRLHVEKIRQIIIQTALTFVSTLIVLIALIYLLAPMMNKATVYYWGILVGITHFTRMAVYFRFKSVSPDGAALLRWELPLAISTYGAALAWGAAPIMMWSVGNPLAQLAVTIPMIGLAAGGAAAYAPLKKIYLPFMLGILLPTMARYFIEGGQIYNAMGILIIVYFIIIAGIARNSNESSTAALLTRFQKEDLAEELEEKIADLETARASLQVLSGLIPICSNCKNIRDDEGYWTKMEHYISEHSEADFTHGMCPDCAKIYFPDVKTTD